MTPQAKQNYSDQAGKAPSSPAMVRWFYKTTDTKHGPVDTETICRLLIDRALAPDTPAWREGLPSWMPAGEIPDLVHAVAAGRASSPAADGSGEIRRTSMPILMLGVVAIIPALWAFCSWVRNELAKATVEGVVTAVDGPVKGGSVILSPVADAGIKGPPGKPAIAPVGTDGRYSANLIPGDGGLAKRFWVRYSPPVLPAMDEVQAKKAVQPYLGLVPQVTEVEVAGSRSRLDIRLVPAGKP